MYGLGVEMVAAMKSICNTSILLLQAILRILATFKPQHQMVQVSILMGQEGRYGVVHKVMVLTFNI